MRSFLQCQQQAATAAIIPAHQVKSANMPCAASCRCQTQVAVPAATPAHQTNKCNPPWCSFVQCQQQAATAMSSDTMQIVQGALAQLPAVSAAASNHCYHPSTPSVSCIEPLRSFQQCRPAHATVSKRRLHLSGVEGLQGSGRAEKLGGE